jgi:hypothetical protein
MGKLDWRKSTYSDAHGQCVEVARAGRTVATRDSTDRDGPVLQMRPAEWGRLLAEIKRGGHDV